MNKKIIFFAAALLLLLLLSADTPHEPKPPEFPYNGMFMAPPLFPY